MASAHMGRQSRVRNQTIPPQIHSERKREFKADLIGFFCVRFFKPIYLLYL